MGLLTRDAILTADDLKFETVKVPEWGGEVRVRAATAAEMDAYDYDLYQTKIDVEKDTTTVVQNFDNTKARLVVKCVVDDKDMRIFKDDDAVLLGKKNSSAVNRVFQRIQYLSGRTKKALEEIEKNSGTGQSEGSPSTLPGT